MLRLDFFEWLVKDKVWELLRTRQSQFPEVMQLAEALVMTDEDRAERERLKVETQNYRIARRGAFGVGTDLLDVGRMLVHYRIYRGWSQTEVAAQAGIAQAKLSRYESALYEGVALGRIAAIARAMDMPVAVHVKTDVLEEYMLGLYE